MYFQLGLKIHFHSRWRDLDGAWEDRFTEFCGRDMLSKPNSNSTTKGLNIRIKLPIFFHMLAFNCILFVVLSLLDIMI